MHTPHQLYQVSRSFWKLLHDFLMRNNGFIFLDVLHLFWINEYNIGSESLVTYWVSVSFDNRPSSLFSLLNNDSGWSFLRERLRKSKSTNRWNFDGTVIHMMKHSDRSILRISQYLWVSLEQREIFGIFLKAKLFVLNVTLERL